MTIELSSPLDRLPELKKAESVENDKVDKLDMETFNLSILAPERRLIEGERAVSLIATTTEGEVEILPGHANLVAILDTGRFQYTIRGEAPVKGVISSGFLNIENGDVKLVAETVELASEINVSRARGAQIKAEEMLKDAALDEHAFKKYQLKLQRALIRQQIGG